jgi:hypothetical protein
LNRLSRNVGFIEWLYHNDGKYRLSQNVGKLQSSYVKLNPRRTKKGLLFRLELLDFKGLYKSTSSIILLHSEGTCASKLVLFVIQD